MDIFRNRFTRKGLWILFAVGAFPLHIWTWVLFFRDFSWIAERTDIWDAIGVGSYGLLVAFAESLFVFTIGCIIRLTLPIYWEEDQWVTVIGIMIILCEVWAITGQLYFLLEWSLPINFRIFLASQEHPLWLMYGSVTALVSLSILLPIYFLIRKPKFRGLFYQFFDRVTLLASLYLFLDFCGFAIILVRNIT